MFLQFAQRLEAFYNWKYISKIYFNSCNDCIDDSLILEIKVVFPLLLFFFRVREQDEDWDKNWYSAFKIVFKATQW